MKKYVVTIWDPTEEISSVNHFDTYTEAEIFSEEKLNDLREDNPYWSSEISCITEDIHFEVLAYDAAEQEVIILDGAPTKEEAQQLLSFHEQKGFFNSYWVEEVTDEDNVPCELRYETSEDELPF